MVPINKVFDLGAPGPSGNENDTYVSNDTIFKVNNLLNGRYTNGELEVWDLLPRNVLKDSEGDIIIIDAEIKLL